MHKLFLVTCLLACCLSSSAKMTESNKVELRIVETSDVHGSFFPYDYVNRKPQRGTLARVSSYVNRLRSQYGDRLVLLDNGDILQGQPISYFSNYVDTTDENIAASVVNYLKYDAETIGNHDVEPGHKVYDKWRKELNCPLLGANVVDTRTGQPYLKPYTMLNKGGVRIAVLGLLTPAIPNWLPKNIWSGLHFDDMVKSARQWMEVIQKTEHPDIVIGLFHSGKEGGITTADYEEDASERVAKEVPGFDIVLFGHDHTRHLEKVTNSKGQTVLCMDPANNALTVAEATIRLEKQKGKWQIVAAEGNLEDVTDEDIDQQYVAHFQSYLDKLAAFADQPIGQCKEKVFARDAVFGNSAFNDFILNLQMSLTGADVSFNAPLSLSAYLPEGEIRMSDMFNLYKYENQLYVMRLTGEEIRKHLEMSYDLWVNTMKSPDDHLLLLSERTQGDAQRLGFKNFLFNFDSAAGIDYEVDVTKPDGQKVHILQMSNGQPFDEKKWYKVAINSYRGNGGGELLTKGAGIPKDSLESRIIYRSPRDQRWYLMEAIKKMSTIDPKPNHNWKFVPEAWTKKAAERDRQLLFGKSK
ncbi:MAG: bifunctional metallophosphatase/5'-nucleotidase [Prevotella sp.]|jgi:2',3'-cyclic-nucleotide 2'-phosphodiesterase/3'-nucleotidase